MVETNRKSFKLESYLIDKAVEVYSAKYSWKENLTPTDVIRKIVEDFIEQNEIQE